MGNLVTPMLKQAKVTDMVASVKRQPTTKIELGENNGMSGVKRYE